MIPKRKPLPANRKARRAEGVKLVKIKRGGGSSGRPSLVERLKAAIQSHDPSVVMSPGLVTGETGWLFHRAGVFTYAVVAGKSRVTLHVVPMQDDQARHARYKKLIPTGEFGKGCIRFKPDAPVDVAVIARLIQEYAEDAS